MYQSYELIIWRLRLYICWQYDIYAAYLHAHLKSLYSGHEKAIRILLREGAYINGRGFLEYTPLIEAVLKSKSIIDFPLVSLIQYLCNISIYSVSIKNAQYLMCILGSSGKSRPIFSRFPKNQLDIFTFIGLLWVILELEENPYNVEFGKRLEMIRNFSGRIHSFMAETQIKLHFFTRVFEGIQQIYYGRETGIYWCRIFWSTKGNYNFYINILSISLKYIICYFNYNSS